MKFLLLKSPVSSNVVELKTYIQFLIQFFNLGKGLKHRSPEHSEG